MINSFLFVVVEIFVLTFGLQNFTDKIYCQQFDDDKAGCEAAPNVDCVYIQLLATTNETVCVPDNCAQYVGNPEGCEMEANCVWYDDENTDVNVTRCYPS